MDASSSYVVSSKPIYCEKISWTGGPSFIQDWSLPESIIYYMAKNPTSPELYFKLVQSCKYFFEKNPVLVVTKMDSCEDVKSFICKNNYMTCSANNRECCVSIDISKIAAKIWLTNELDIRYGGKNFVSLLLPKLYRCEIDSIGIYDKDILFEDYKFLVSSAKVVLLKNNSILYGDGKTVMLDKILEYIPHLEDFSFTFLNDNVLVLGASLKNLLKLQNLQNLVYFELIGIPESFAVEDLSVLITKYKDVQIYLEFNRNISEYYKNQLDILIDAVIGSEIPNRLIIYDGQDAEKERIMDNRFEYVYDD